MKNKGFTLIELLGVIIIISLLALIVLPSIVNSIRNSSEKIDDVTLDLIYKATDLYISYNESLFPKEEGNTYLIYISDLVDENLLTDQIKLSNNENLVDNNYCVEVTYNEGYSYDLIECY